MTEAPDRAPAPDRPPTDGGTRLLRTSLLEPPPTRAVPVTGAISSGDTGRIIVPVPDELPAPTPRVAVRLEEVGKVYPNGKHALMDVDLVVPEGDFVFLVGPSGAGKSTLIKLLVHDEESTSGIIHVAGYDLTHLGRGDIPKLRRQIGIVFQDFRLLPRKTVRENVAFALQVTGTPRRQIRSTVDRLLALVGLSAQAEQRPSQLSGGEQQRTAIARAMVHDPRLIIADEPTGNLDPLISWEIIQLLLRINELGTTVLMATHNAEVVTALRKRVVALESGRIVRDEVGGYHREYA
jgi:cell division transport system ATP-binding protein